MCKNLVNLFFMKTQSSDTIIRSLQSANTHLHVAGRGGDLVENMSLIVIMTFNRRVVGSTPALPAT